MRALALASVLVVLVVDRPARACSPPMCQGGTVVPSKGPVPANLPALHWLPELGFDGTATEPPFRLLDGGTELELRRIGGDVRSGLLLAPAAPLPVGHTVRFEGDSGCLDDPTVAELEVGPAAALPTALGTLAIEPTFRDYLSSGPCGGEIDGAQVRARVVPGDDARPWANALVFETHVDGKPWTRPAPRGEALVFAFCGPGRWDDFGADKGLAPGLHTLKMSARIVGTATVLGTATWTVDLRCEAPWAAPVLRAGPLEGTSTADGGCAHAAPPLVALLLVLARARRSSRS